MCSSDLDGAITLFSQAVRYAPDDAEASFYLGMLYRESGRFEDALSHLAHAAKLNPHSPQIHSNIAGVHLRLGQRSEGQQALRRSEILRQKERGIGSEISQPSGGAVAIGPATARYNMALNLALRGQYEEAIVAYQNALELNPDLKDAHSGLGILLTWKGELDGAAQSLRSAVDLDPQDPINRTRLGMVYYKQGRLYPARAELEMALVLDDALAEAAYGLGLVEARQGQMDAAAAHFAHASQLRPDYAEALMNLGVTRMRLNQPAAAIDSYLQVAELDPDNVRIHMYLSDAYAQLGDGSRSEAHRARARELKEGS